MAESTAATKAAFPDIFTATCKKCKRKFSPEGLVMHQRRIPDCNKKNHAS